MHHNEKIDDYESINSVNPFYLIIDEVDGFIGESNGNEYLTFASTNSNNKFFKKYTELWDGIKNSIEKINNNKSGKHGKDSMNIKFESDDNLPLNKILKLHMLTVIVSSVFEEDGKYYPQVFLNDCFYQL